RTCCVGGEVLWSRHWRGNIGMSAGLIALLLVETALLPPTSSAARLAAPRARPGARHPAGGRRGSTTTTRDAPCSVVGIPVVCPRARPCRQVSPGARRPSRHGPGRQGWRAIGADAAQVGATRHHPRSVHAGL